MIIQYSYFSRIGSALAKWCQRSKKLFPFPGLERKDFFGTEGLTKNNTRTGSNKERGQGVPVSNGPTRTKKLYSTINFGAVYPESSFKISPSIMDH